MMKENVIEPAQTKCVSSVVLVLKNNGQLYFYTDYREINADIARDSCLVWE